MDPLNDDKPVDAVEEIEETPEATDETADAETEEAVEPTEETEDAETEE